MSRRLPSSASWQRLLLHYGPVLAPTVKQLYEQGRWRQLAIAHARTVQDGTFSHEVIDGSRHWVVWVGDEPIAAYPERSGEWQQALRHARPERRRDPEGLPLRSAGRAAAERARLLADGVRDVRERLPGPPVRRQRPDA